METDKPRATGSVYSRGDGLAVTACRRFLILRYTRIHHLWTGGSGLQRRCHLEKHAHSTWLDLEGVASIWVSTVVRLVAPGVNLRWPMRKRTPTGVWAWNTARVFFLLRDQDIRWFYRKARALCSDYWKITLAVTPKRNCTTGQRLLITPNARR